MTTIDFKASILRIVDATAIFCGVFLGLVNIQYGFFTRKAQYEVENIGGIEAASSALGVRSTTSHTVDGIGKTWTVLTGKSASKETINKVARSFKINYAKIGLFLMVAFFGGFAMWLGAFSQTDQQQATDGTFRGNFIDLIVPLYLILFAFMVFVDMVFEMCGPANFGWKTTTIVVLTLAVAAICGCLYLCRPDYEKDAWAVWTYTFQSILLGFIAGGYVACSQFGYGRVFMFLNLLLIVMQVVFMVRAYSDTATQQYTPPAA